MKHAGAVIILACVIMSSCGPSPEETPKAAIDEYASLVEATTTPTKSELGPEKSQYMESINEYKESLFAQENSGGSLQCDSDAEPKTEDYKSCTSFYSLREKGCHGYNQFDMNQAAQYELLCREIKALDRASAASINYFDMESTDWWKSIPAEVIPYRGGINNQDGLDEERLFRDNLVVGKSLGDIDFVKLSVSPNSLVATLSTEEVEACGRIEDVFYFRVALLADFDGDGISELWLKGSRAYQSETCHLGSANTLGAGFSAYVNRDGPMEVPSAIRYEDLFK